VLVLEAVSRFPCFITYLSHACITTLIFAPVCKMPLLMARATYDAAVWSLYGSFFNGSCSWSIHAGV
jgi:hypothetical protein